MQFVQFYRRTRSDFWISWRSRAAALLRIVNAPCTLGPIGRKAWPGGYHLTSQLQFRQAVHLAKSPGTRSARAGATGTDGKREAGTDGGGGGKERQLIFFFEMGWGRKYINGEGGRN